MRHINFAGTTRINDEVLRREMRQLEGGWLSNAAVERSKQRIQRLPYIEKVEFETTPVPGSADLVDVDFNIKEGLPGQFGGGIGYSESQSVHAQRQLRRTATSWAPASAWRSRSTPASTARSTASRTPTRTPRIDNIVAHAQRCAYRDVTQFVSASSDFSSKTMTGGLDYGYPITEIQALRFGLGVAELRAGDDVDAAARARPVEWVRTTAILLGAPTLDGCGRSPTTSSAPSSTPRRSSLGWGFDSRNRALFADRGARHSLYLTYALPVSDVEFFTANYDYLQFIPLTGAGSRCW